MPYPWLGQNLWSRVIEASRDSSGRKDLSAVHNGRDIQRLLEPMPIANKPRYSRCCGGFVQHGLFAASRIRALGQDRAAADKR